MKRLIYIISALLLISCAREVFPEPDDLLTQPAQSPEISPSAYVSQTQLPPGATKALVNAGTVASMEANALRIDENIGEGDAGLYEYASWEDAYLVEATVASTPSSEGLRSMYLNPVQAYKYKVTETAVDTIFYHTRMVSWYPRTCTLHKNDQGKASVMQFKDFNDLRDGAAYTTNEDGSVLQLRFAGLDGSKDVMVSNIVEGQHWHGNDSDEIVGGTDRYTYPFGHNDATPKYSNSLTYKHFLSAVKVYAYTENSDQDVSMWGALRKVVVKNQPDTVLVTLPAPSEMTDAKIENRVQVNSLDYGSASFRGNVDFPLIKTPVFGEDAGSSEGNDVAEDEPHLSENQEVYLGYAMIEPEQALELDVYTDAGVISVEVPVTETVGETTYNYFQAGYIYTVRINFNTEGAIAGIVLQSGNEHYYDLSSASEFDGGVHEQKLANCYIVDTGLTRTDANGNEVPYDGYAFTATTVGNGSTGLYSDFASDRTTVDIDPVRAGLLWESEQGLVTQVELLYGYVRFKVTSGKEGNAVIAVYDSQRKVLWSWHIWITDKPEDVSYKVGENEIVLLDRNLGATAAKVDDGLLETYGLYYQWGRKDPSMGPPDASYLPQSMATWSYYDYYGDEWTSAGVVTMAQPGLRDGVENPMYLLLPTDLSMTSYQYDWLYSSIDNLWGDYDHTSTESTSTRQKTIYDPCPFGYMVPQDEISTVFASLSSADTGNGYTINGSFFPFAGYKGVDKGVSSLSGAWRYVGRKGDYMSSKIEANGHRSRTYISDASSWTEYGADADNDGDGDASRYYSGKIHADDMANRRTAGSVRCVKRAFALNASVVASFTTTAGRNYFFSDEDIVFEYDIKVMGGDKIASAIIDRDEGTATVATLAESGGGSELNGTISLAHDSGTDHTEHNPGIHRFRLVTKTENGVTSRVSYPVNVVKIQNVKVDGDDYSSVNFAYGQKYTVTFDVVGEYDGYEIYLNGVKATPSTVTNVEDGAETVSFTATVYVPGHLNFYLFDSDGNPVVNKEYEVTMSGAASSYTLGNQIHYASELEAGGMYIIKSASYDYYWTASDSGLTMTSSPTSFDASCVFLYHKDDSRAGGNGYGAVSAGAWKSMSEKKYLTADFALDAELENAVFITSANNWGYYEDGYDIDMYRENTGSTLKFSGSNGSFSFEWTTDLGGNAYRKWYIYKAEPVTR